MPQILIFFCKPWPAALAEKSLLQMLLRIELSWEKVLIRSSHRRCSIKEGVLRNFSKFTGKHLCQSLFFNKVASSCRHEATLLKKRFWHAYFPVNFEKFLRRPFLQNTEWLLLIHYQAYYPSSISEQKEAASV